MKTQGLVRRFGAAGGPQRRGGSNAKTIKAVLLLVALLVCSSSLVSPADCLKDGQTTLDVWFSGTPTGQTSCRTINLAANTKALCIECLNNMIGTVTIDTNYGDVSCNLAKVGVVYNSYTWPPCAASFTLVSGVPLEYRATASVWGACHCSDASDSTGWYTVYCGTLSTVSTVPTTVSTVPTTVCIPLGQSCSSAGQCCSGYCVDGVCCNSACAEDCRLCNRPGYAGQCVAEADGGYLTYRKGFGVGYGDNYYGDIAWADRYARCCPGAADNVNASGACVSSRVGAPSAPLINYSIAMVAGGGGNDTYSVPWGDGLTTDGWLECDYYANATGGDSGWCSSVCPGGFVLAGEAGVGEYEPASVSNGGRSDMGSNAYGYAECCGDDANEYYKQAKWGGVNYSSCCNNATDYVNESSMCRPSCVDCGGQNKIDSSGVCTNPDANTTSGKYVCETCWSKNHSLGRFWVWDPLVNSTRDCCGDDANEEYLHTRGYDGGLFDVAWGNVTGDDSCCFGNLNDGRCVFGHKCFNGSIGGGQFVYLVAPDILEAVVGCNGTSRTWFDVDGAAWACRNGSSFNVTWAKSGELGAFGEYGSYANGGDPAAGGFECCGDDAGEYYRKTEWDSVNYSACCDSATDWVNQSGSCRSACVGCGGQNRTDSLGVCTNPDDNTQSGEFVCENCLGKRHSLGTSWSWDPYIYITRRYCCGDDANEEYSTRKTYDDGGLFDVAWGNDTSDDSCCWNASDGVGKCVYGHTCLNGSVGLGPYIHNVSAGGSDKTVLCNGSERRWRDLDGSQADCENARTLFGFDSRWALSGEYEPVGEYIGYNVSSGLFYGDSSNGGDPAAGGFECCGDDEGEYYHCNVAHPDVCACCGSATDAVDRFGVCLTASEAAAAEELRACWSFDVADGSDSATAIDVVGGHTGVLSGGVSQVYSELKGQAYLFDGGDGRIEVPDYLTWGIDLGRDDFTLSAWVSLQDTGRQYDTVVDFLSIATARFALQHYGSGNTGWNMHESVPGGGDIAVEGSVNTPAETWVYITLVRSGSSWSIYRNAQLIASSNYGDTQNTPSGFTIGHTSEGAISPRGFLGRMDEFAVWGVALSPSEVRSIYDSGGLCGNVTRGLSTSSTTTTSLPSSTTSSSTTTSSTLPVDGECASTLNDCLKGVFQDATDNETHFKWYCNGIGSGALTDRCNLSKNVTRVCELFNVTCESSTAKVDSIVAFVNNSGEVIPCTEIQGIGWLERNLTFRCDASSVVFDQLYDVLCDVDESRSFSYEPPQAVTVNITSCTQPLGLLTCNDLCEAAYPFTPTPMVAVDLYGECFGVQMGGNCQAECSWWEVELPGSNCGGTQPKCCCGNCLINLNTWNSTQNCELAAG